MIRRIEAGAFVYIPIYSTSTIRFTFSMHLKRGAVQNNIYLQSLSHDFQHIKEIFVQQNQGGIKPEGQPMYSV